MANQLYLSHAQQQALTREPDVPIICWYSVHRHRQPLKTLVRTAAFDP